MKDPSLVVGLNLLKEGKADAFISAGSTGAILAGGQFIVGRAKGVNENSSCAFTSNICHRTFTSF